MQVSGLDRLPGRKRRELERVAGILFDEFEDALKTKLSEKGKRGRILKLILFGSYARGDWVEDHKSGYRSDYDVLVVVNYDSFAEQHEAWEKAAERFLQELTVTKHLATPVNFIVHTIMDVNDQLRRGRPFFVDIARDGVVIYEVPGHPLASPVNLAPEEARAEARRYFEHWFPLGGHALKLASPQGLFARQRFLGHKRNMGYATRFNRAIGSLSGWNSPAGSRLACSQR